MASIFGNLGQSDYAYANGFMDGFAQYRENLRAQHKRQGKTTVINWPLWQEGGMQVDVATREWMEKTWGSTPLSTVEGIKAFVRVVSQEGSQYLVLSNKKQEAPLGTIEIKDQIDATSINENYY